MSSLLTTDPGVLTKPGPRPSGVPYCMWPYPAMCLVPFDVLMRVHISVDSQARE